MTLTTSNTASDNLPDPPFNPSPEKVWTPEELLQLPDEKGYELVNGKLVERQMGANSSRVAMRIAQKLDGFLSERAIAHVFGADAGYQCFPDDARKVRKPDVSVVLRERMAEKDIPDGYCLIPPDLAIEVVSPKDLAYEINEKVWEYLSAGVRLIWVVFPDTKSVGVYRERSSAQGSSSQLSGADTITGEDVLPGFSCQIEKFFAD